MNIFSRGTRCVRYFYSSSLWLNCIEPSAHSHPLLFLHHIWVFLIFCTLFFIRGGFSHCFTFFHIFFPAPGCFCQFALLLHVIFLCMHTFLCLHAFFLLLHVFWHVFLPVPCPFTPPSLLYNFFWVFVRFHTFSCVYTFSPWHVFACICTVLSNLFCMCTYYLCCTHFFTAARIFGFGSFFTSRLHVL